MSQPSLLSINSYDRIDRYNTSSTDFKIDVKTLYDIQTIELVSASIPNTVYNMVNNRIYFTENGYPANFAIIPDGAYDINLLLLEIASALNSVSVGTFSVSYYEPWFRLTLVNTLPFTIDQENYELGFRITTSYVSLLNAHYALKLHIPKIYVLRIKEFNYGNIESSGSAHGNFIINSRVNSSYIDQYAKFSDYQQQQVYTSQTINQLNITLLDDKNDVLQLNGSDFTFTLRLTYKKTSCGGY